MKSIPQWASMIVITVAGFFLMLFINDLRAQDVKCSNKIETAEIEIQLIKQGLKYELESVRNQLAVIGAAQKEVKLDVRNNVEKIDRIGYLMEQMANKQGIQ